MTESVEEWLQLATGENDETKGVDFSTEFEGDGYRFATNGFVIHVAKGEKPLKFFPEQETIGIDTNKWQDQVTETICINPRFIIEALDIFKNDLQVIVSISKDIDGHPKMLIEGVQEGEGLSAWIMGMTPLEDENE